MDFYIFWKFGFCRTLPSLRQLFYPLVNPIVISPSIPIHPPIYSTHPTFIQISPNTPLTLLITYYPLLPPIPTLHLSTSYPQVINSLSTAFPQPPTLLIDLLSTPIFPLILLFLQSSPL